MLGPAAHQLFGLLPLQANHLLQMLCSVMCLAVKQPFEVALPLCEFGDPITLLKFQIESIFLLVLFFVCEVFDGRNVKFPFIYRNFEF